MIWTDSFLNRLTADAVGQIAVDVPCIFAREAITITKGLSTYTLPSYVRTVRRITWRGRSLDAVSWEELQMLTPATVFVAVGSSSNIESSISRPLYYAMHPTDPYDIRLYPTPDETFLSTGFNVYAPQNNQACCVVDYYREPDLSETVPAISLPIWVARRAKKAYVLWKAFNAEGKGQNLRASKYYKMRYDMLSDAFRLINDSCFVGKKYSIDDGMLTVDNFRYPRPILPSQFERVNF